MYGSPVYGGGAFGEFQYSGTLGQVVDTNDPIPPSGSITFPIDLQVVSGTITVTANASDNVAVAGVQFKRDSNVNIGAEDTSAPYSVSLDTTALSEGYHTIYAVIRDMVGNTFTTSAVNVLVNNIGPLVCKWSTAQVCN